MGVMIQYIRIYLLWPIQGVPTTNEIYLLIPPLGVGYRGSLTSPAGALYSAAPVIWQVVPSTDTCKSINLDLARAARYRYFTQYRPAHADQIFIQQNLLPSLVPPRVLGGVATWRRLVRMDTTSPGRSAR